MLLSSDTLLDRLQGACLELGAALLRHGPMLLAEVGRSDTKDASMSSLAAVGACLSRSEWPHLTLWVGPAGRETAMYVYTTRLSRGWS